MFPYNPATVLHHHEQCMELLKYTGIALRNFEKTIYRENNRNIVRNVTTSAYPRVLEMGIR